jgi:hypothetical protein
MADEKKPLEIEGREAPVTIEDNPPEKNKKNKFSSLILAGVIGGLVTACAGLGVYHFMNTDKGYPVKDAQVVMQEQTNPKLKAAKTNNKKIYEISDASDSMNGLTVSVEGIQFRRDQTRLMVHLKNDGKSNVSTVFAAAAKLVDDKGHTYNADPFASWSAPQIPVGMDETVMLVFDPIRDAAGTLTFTADNLTNTKDAPWNVEISFDIPE